MKRSAGSVAGQVSDAAETENAQWAGARITTQSVAFRVIGVEDDDADGRKPVWGACPLTEEEENILRGLSQRIR